MAVYYGVVRDNRVELEGDARLASGVRVEVRPRSVSTQEDDAAADEILRAEGLLEDEPSRPSCAPFGSFNPVIVTGQPLSEQIIEERR